MGSPEDDTKKSPISDAPAFDGDGTTDVNVVAILEDASPSTVTPPTRRTARSIPPPIPSAERRKQITVGMRAQPDPVKPDERMPTKRFVAQQATVLDRALASVEVDQQARAEQLRKDVAAQRDPAEAATLSYELGELYERRLDDEERALEAYRRAYELDPTLRPNLWALRRVLYRRALWPDLVKLIDVELGSATTDHERVEWLVERAIVSGHGGSDAHARTSLEGALQLVPRHQGALLELERVVARIGDLPAAIETWSHLAEAIGQPERKIAYGIEVARHVAQRDYDRAQAALATAAMFAPLGSTTAERIAFERLRIADEQGTPAQIETAIETLVQVLSANPGPASERELARKRQLTGLRRRQAQLARAEAPLRSWAYLEQALALAPEDPVVIVDLIELAGELDRLDEIAPLITAWHGAEDDAGRAAILSAWAAESHLAPSRSERRNWIRALLRSLDGTSPGLLVLTSIAECEALADPTRSRAQLDLANAHLAAAHAAARGTWLGPWSPARPDPEAAAALYSQAAYLLAYYVGTPAAFDQARGALETALETAPMHPAVIEALIELDDSAGRPEQAIARLRTTAERTPMRSIIERSIRLAYNHELAARVVELQRELVVLEPADHPVAWSFESSLSQLPQQASERAELLSRLARDDTEPARRRTALFDAARLHARLGDVKTATDLYRQLRVAAPDEPFARDALIDLLRSQQRWPELVTERRAEAAASHDTLLVRRALREAAWVLEMRVGDIAQAAIVYEQWLARIPNDRTALEGIARCRAALGEFEIEAIARASIAEIDQTATSRWLYARSLERAARYDWAEQQYRSLISDEDALVATSATLALGDLAARGTAITKRVEAAEALAARTVDPRLGTALFEYVGWLHVVALENFKNAAKAFTAALELQPARQGALLGSALVAATSSDRQQTGTAYAALAATVEMPEAAVALYLRAAAIAEAVGDTELAHERVEAARTVAPDNVNALFVATELPPPRPSNGNDPFAAVDRLLERAEMISQRGSLAADPESRRSWELDRADALQLAGQHREAAAVIAAVLEAKPDDWRALLAWRAIAERSSNKVTRAQASYALGVLGHDPALKLRMLRAALDVYDRGAANHRDYALAIYRRILTVDPGAPEFDRLLELLRERSDTPALISALTDRLTWIASTTGEVPAMITLLFERSTLLRSIDRIVEAASGSRRGPRSRTEGRRSASPASRPRQRRRRSQARGHHVVALPRGRDHGLEA